MQNLAEKSRTSKTFAGTESAISHNFFAKKGVCMLGLLRKRPQFFTFPATSACSDKKCFQTPDEQVQFLTSPAEQPGKVQ